jgi:hypothetical protein
MLRILLVIILLAVVAILVYAAVKPNEFRVQRTQRINAPPERIFALINDFHRWVAWSPYEKKDPAMTKSFSGSESGEGAVYAWAGDKNVGKGRMEIMQSTLPRVIAIKLDFEAPFEAHNMAEFLLMPDGDAIAVTWSVRGPQPYIAKVMSIFFNMDKMIGSDFEVGLGNLKRVAETGA